jgi:hypothetical protein
MVVEMNGLSDLMRVFGGLCLNDFPLSNGEIVVTVVGNMPIFPV